MSLKKKVAIVTGGGSGIGRETVLTLAKLGCTVVIAGRTKKSIEKVSSEVEALNSESFAIQTDVSISSDVEKMVGKTLKKFGRVDILVSNAGITSPLGPTINKTEDIWDKIIDTNLKGCFLSCKAVLKSMMRQKSGKIITISSILAKIGFVGALPYVASKGGIEALTRALAKEVARYGINVNCVSPGLIDTKILDTNPDAKAQSVINLIPKGRIGNPRDVANVIAFLVSDQADYITGQIITVDGGWS